MSWRPKEKSIYKKKKGSGNTQAPRDLSSFLLGWVSYQKHTLVLVMYDMKFYDGSFPISEMPAMMPHSMCVCMRMHVCTRMYLHAHIFVESKGQPQVSSSLAICLNFPDREFLLEPSDCARLPGRLQGSFPCLLSCAELQACATIESFSQWHLEMELKYSCLPGKLTMSYYQCKRAHFLQIGTLFSS